MSQKYIENNKKIKILGKNIKNFKVSFGFSLILSLWIFIGLLFVPTNAVTNSYTDVSTSFFTMMNLNNSIVIIPSIFGIITILLFLLSVVFLVKFIKTKNEFNDKQELKFKSIYIYSTFAITTLLFAFAMIPPLSFNNLTLLDQVSNMIKWDFTAITANQKTEFINLLNKYNLNTANVTANALTQVTFADLQQKLSTSEIFINKGIFTAMWDYENSFVYANGGWYFVIVIYSVFLFGIFGTFSYASLKGLKLNNVVDFQSNKKTNTKSFRESLQEIRENSQKQKSKKKELIKEEEALLKNLKEVKVEESKDNLKTKLDDVRKERENIKQSNKSNDVKLNKTKNKKSSISVPDEELERIFKDLEIE